MERKQSERHSVLQRSDLTAGQMQLPQQTNHIRGIVVSLYVGADANIPDFASLRQSRKWIVADGRNHSQAERQREYENVAAGGDHY